MVRRGWVLGATAALAAVVALALATGQSTSPRRSSPTATSAGGSSASDLLRLLDSIPVRAEVDRDGFARELFPHWDDDDSDGCDTRCEILARQRRPDGTWLSPWDGYSTSDASELHVDHVVALAEAWDSGAAEWDPARRDRFADHLPNLLVVSAPANVRKGDRDAALWFPSRSEANCLWASLVVQVKHEWNLTVDAAERDALENLLRSCPD